MSRNLPIFPGDRAVVQRKDDVGGIVQNRGGSNPPGPPAPAFPSRAPIAKMMAPQVPFPQKVGLLVRFAQPTKYGVGDIAQGGRVIYPPGPPVPAFSSRLPVAQMMEASSSVKKRMAFSVGDIKAGGADVTEDIGRYITRKIPGINVPNHLTDHKKPFQDIGDGWRIYLIGHGTISPSHGVAVEFGGMTPDRLVEFLIEKGMTSKFGGKIYLNGCNTATGGKGSFAYKFKESLNKRNIYCNVKGNAATSSINLNGKVVFVPRDERERYRKLQGDIKEQCDEIARINKIKERSDFMMEMRNDPLLCSNLTYERASAVSKINDANAQISKMLKEDKTLTVKLGAGFIGSILRAFS